MEKAMKQSLGARTLLFPTPVLMVGTYDHNGKPNLMNAAWGGICCSQPPCVAVSLRKATYSWAGIVERKAFTVGIACEARMVEADYVGIASGRTVDKFAISGLTPLKSDLVDAPYVQEFPLILECKVIHALEIGLHTQFIGQIMDVKVDEAVLGEKGAPDLMKLKPIVFGPEIRAYHGLGAYLGKAFSIGKKTD